jgi:biotin carboxyl carrier protein
MSADKPTIRYYVTVHGHEHTVDITESPTGGPARVALDGDPVEADLVPLSGAALHSLILDGHSREMILGRDGTKVTVWLDGEKMDVVVYDEVSKALSSIGGAAAAGPSVVAAPMPGVVVDIPVKVGDVIEVGTAVVVLEAMKMQNELTAESAGIVDSIEVTVGQNVAGGDTLVKLKPVEG